MKHGGKETKAHLGHITEKTYKSCTIWFAYF